MTTTTVRWTRTAYPADVGDGVVEHANYVVDDQGHVVVEESLMAQMLLDAGWERTA